MTMKAAMTPRLSLIAADDMAEGYHVYVGGGYGERQGIGRELYRNIPATKAPVVVERMLRTYLGARQSPVESFLEFVRRLPTDALAGTFGITEGVAP